MATLACLPCDTCSCNPLRLILADSDSVDSKSIGKSPILGQCRQSGSSKQDEGLNALEKLRRNTQISVERIVTAKQKSVQLTTYAKMMFENALSSSTCSPNSKRISLKNLRPHTTGPTLYGSLLYNPKTMVLNAIRTKSSKPQQYSDQYPEAFDYRRYNYKYYVTTRKEIIALSDDEDDEVSDELMNIPCESEDIEMTDMPRLSIGNVAVDDSRCYVNTLSNDIQINLPLINLPLSELTDDASSKKQTQPPNLVVQSPSSTYLGDCDNIAVNYGKPCRSKSLLPPKAVSKTKIRSRPTSARSDISRRTLRSRGNKSGNHTEDKHIDRHWVDDITVSEPSSRPPRLTVMKRRKQQMTIRGAKTARSHNPLEDINSEEVTLPMFVCPSSEEKSRHFMCLTWVSNTNFSRGCRTVPLL